MVKIMLGSMPQEREEIFRDGGGGLAGGGQSPDQRQGWHGGWSQTLASQDSTGHPSECILWCTIALGALVQGCSSEFVSYPPPAHETDCCRCTLPIHGNVVLRMKQCTLICDEDVLSATVHWYDILNLWWACGVWTVERIGGNVTTSWSE